MPLQLMVRRSTTAALSGGGHPSRCSRSRTLAHAVTMSRRSSTSNGLRTVPATTSGLSSRTVVPARRTKGSGPPVFGPAPHPLQHFPSVLERHHEVDERDRVTAALHRLDRFVAVLGRVDGEAAPPQDREEQHADGFVVVDYQDSFSVHVPRPEHTRHLHIPLSNYRAAIYERTPRASRFSARIAAAGRVSAKSRTISRLNAGRSSGLRLLTHVPSRMHSLSCHVAPALRRSSCSVGQLVIVCPRTRPAETSSHGPWQMTAIGLPARSISCTNCCAFFSMRRASSLMTPPGSITASKSAASAFDSARSHLNLSALSWCLNPCTSSFGAISTHVAPAFSRASRGLVISICSKPSVTRMATRFPLSSFAM